MPDTISNVAILFIEVADLDVSLVLFSFLPVPHRHQRRYNNQDRCGQCYSLSQEEAVFVDEFQRFTPKYSIQGFDVMLYQLPRH